MFTLLVFLMLEYGGQRIEIVEDFKTRADCELAAKAATKAWSLPKTKVEAVCVEGKK
jgi:hypothetical protein